MQKLAKTFEELESVWYKTSGKEKKLIFQKLLEYV